MHKMKKEEQQKNKSDEKISFFNGVEESKEAVSFFGAVRDFFKKNVIAKKTDSQRKPFLIKNDDDNKKADANKALKNKIPAKKETEAAILKDSSKEASSKKVDKIEDKKNANNKQSDDAYSWSASNILSTNLIKGESTVVYHWDRQTNILIANVLAVIFLLSLTYGGLVYWEKKGQDANRELDASVDAFKMRIEKLKKETEEIGLFNEKIAVAKDLLATHIYWENFFEFLENNILADVYLPDSFKGETDGQYTFRAYTKDLKTMLDQANYLRQEDKKDKILSVEISNVSTGDDVGSVDEPKAIKEKYKVSFDLTIRINKDIFYKK